MPPTQPVAPGGEASPAGSAVAAPMLGVAKKQADLAARSEAAGFEDDAVLQLLAATDDESVEQLAAWLKANAKTWAPVVRQAVDTDSGLSAEAACAVLDALLWRAPTDEETTLALMEACLRVISARISESLGDEGAATSSEHDDALVGSAVGIVTANRRSKLAETAIACLAEQGPGGALVLARAFDPVRSSLKLYIVRRLDPADVLALGDNVVASLAASVSKLAEELEGGKRNVATQFVASLGSVHQMESAEIGVDEPLEVGTPVFHASWGAGTVVAACDESVTIDFGSAGTRTLLRALATLRHAG